MLVLRSIFWHQCLMVLLMGFASAASAADADAEVERVLEYVLRLATDGVGSEKDFQFEYHYSQFDDQQRLRTHRAIVERKGGETAVLNIDHCGLPYAYFANGKIVILDRQQPGTLMAIENARFLFQCGSVPIPDSGFAILRDRKPSQIALDLRGLLLQVMHDGADKSYDRRRHVLRFTKANGSWTEVRLSRRHHKNTLPIASVEARNVLGQGITICNIYVGQPFRRSICASEDFEDRLDKLEVQRCLSDEKILAEYFQKGKVYEHDGSSLYVQASEKLQSLLPMLDEKISSDIERLRHHVQVLSGEPNYREVDYSMRQTIVHSYRHALQWERKRDLLDVTFYISDYDRHRTAAAAEDVFGRELYQQLCEAWCKTALNPSHSADVRMSAFNSLGDLGLPAGSPLLEKLECLEKEAPQELKLALSAARVRLGIAQDADIEALQSGFRTMRDINPNVRYHWLSALAMASELAAVRSEVYEALSKTAPDSYYAANYLRAVAWNDEGRDIVLQLLEKDEAHPELVKPMVLVLSQINENHPLHARSIAVLQKLAADSEKTPEVRTLAEALIAHGNQGERTFKK